MFWAITQPVWSFPTHALSLPRNLAFAAYIVIAGTLVPIQIAGGLAVVGAVVWVQSQRGKLESEPAPRYGAGRGVRSSPILREASARNAQANPVVE